MRDETPLESQIEVVDDGRSAVCNCCAAEDGTVMRLILGWREKGNSKSHGGATSVNLCRSCRVATADAIDEANNPNGDHQVKQAMALVAKFHRKHGAPVIDRVATPEEMALARAVIALDAECRRLRSEAVERERRVEDLRMQRNLMQPIVYAAEGWLDGTISDVEMRQAVVNWNVEDRPDMPAPPSPGASEPSEADVEAVARALHAATERERRTFRTWEYMADVAHDEYRIRAREAIRLGADPGKAGQP